MDFYGFLSFPPKDNVLSLCLLDPEVSSRQDSNCAQCNVNEGKCYDVDDDGVHDVCKCPTSRSTRNEDDYKTYCDTQHGKNFFISFSKQSEFFSTHFYINKLKQSSFRIPDLSGMLPHFFVATWASAFVSKVIRAPKIKTKMALNIADIQSIDSIACFRTLADFTLWRINIV